MSKVERSPEKGHFQLLLSLKFKVVVADLRFSLSLEQKGNTPSFRKTILDTVVCLL